MLMTNQKGDGCVTPVVHGFSHVKEERWTKKDIGEFVNRDLMVNNIYEILVLKSKDIAWSI